MWNVIGRSLRVFFPILVACLTILLEFHSVWKTGSPLASASGTAALPACSSGSVHSLNGNQIPFFDIGPPSHNALGAGHGQGWNLLGCGLWKIMGETSIVVRFFRVPGVLGLAFVAAFLAAALTVLLASGCRRCSLGGSPDDGAPRGSGSCRSGAWGAQCREVPALRDSVDFSAFRHYGIWLVVGAVIGAAAEQGPQDPSSP